MFGLAGIELISDRIPDETTILAFRHLLERRELVLQIYCFAEEFVYETVKAHLSARSPSAPEAKKQVWQAGSGDVPDQEGQPPAAELLHGDEVVVYGDAGYQGLQQLIKLEVAAGWRPVRTQRGAAWLPQLLLAPAAHHPGG